MFCPIYFKLSRNYDIFFSSRLSLIISFEELIAGNKNSNRHKISSINIANPYQFPYYIPTHTSKINGLCSSLNSKKMLQNLLCFYNKKTYVVFFVFHFEQLSFCPNECPGLCRHRPGHSLVKKIKLLEMKNEKNYMGFLILKI